jgi:3',5'-cyclic AMP phosphodiesterase CpdA
MSTTRRALAPAILVVLSVCAGPPALVAQTSSRELVRFGMVTDVHFADIDPNGARTYRDSDRKLAECVSVMNDRQVDFLVELGDFKDQDQAPQEARTLGFLRHIESVFAGFKGPRYHVMGNHDVDSLSKAQFLSIAQSGAGASGEAHYAFTQKGVRFIVLDADHKADGSDYDRGNFDWGDANIDAAQLAWLERTLAAAGEPAVVFIHQQLDGEGAYYVKNAPAVRRVLEASGRVLAVFQGHRHEGAYSVINGIPYYTLKGVIEGSGPDANAYAIVEVREDGTLWVTGYRKAVSQGFRAVPALSGNARGR